MSADFASVLVDSLDDDALAQLAERLAPLIAQRIDPAAAGRLLNCREVGEMLGLHERTVSRMASEGRLKGEKVGRGWRFDPTRLTVMRREQRDLGAPPARRRRAGTSVAAAIRGSVER